MTPITHMPLPDRLIQAADELFYARGIRAVSVDKVIDRAGTTKVTFYRHFRSKDDLVVAYLEYRAALERDGVEAAIAYGAGDVDASLRAIAEGSGAAACTPGFRGCPFINAAAEFPDAGSPVRKIVDAHRRWWTHAFERLVAPLGPADPAAIADDLMLLRDGVVVAGYLGDPTRIATSFFRSSQATVRCAEGSREATRTSGERRLSFADLSGEQEVRRGLRDGGVLGACS